MGGAEKSPEMGWTHLWTSPGHSIQVSGLTPYCRMGVLNLKETGPGVGMGTIPGG